MAESIFPDHIEYIPDIVFATGGGRPLHLDMMRPKTSGETLHPVVVYIHGGGWRGGSHKQMGMNQHFALNGFIAVSVEYRLSSEQHFPAQLEDCKAAIRWIRAHADQYGIDAERIGVFGTSAGGHLAALLGLSWDVPELEGSGGWSQFSSKVHAVADGCGPTDLNWASGWLKSLTMFMYSKLKGAPFMENVDFPSFLEATGFERTGTLLMGGALEDNEDLVKLANPLNYIRKDAPPFLILHGEWDPYVHILQSSAFAEALQSAGADATFLPVKSSAHSFSATIDGTPNHYVYTELVEFFQKYLQEKHS